MSDIHRRTLQVKSIAVYCLDNFSDKYGYISPGSGVSVGVVCHYLESQSGMGDFNHKRVGIAELAGRLLD
jgi:hypothetical protein